MDLTKQGPQCVPPPSPATESVSWQYSEYQN
jgi:hypothetical protein